MASPDAEPQYVRSPFLDERYQQSKISVTPFSSPKRHLVRVEKVLPPISIATHKPAKSEEAYLETHGVIPYFSCKMNYPYSLTSHIYQSPQSKKTTSKDLSEDEFVPEDNYKNDSQDTDFELDFQDTSSTSGYEMSPKVAAAFATPPKAQHPNPYWQQPPPTFDPVPDHVNPTLKLKKDDWHEYIATKNAAQRALNDLPKSRPAAANASDLSQPGSGSQAEDGDGVGLTLRAATLISNAIHCPLAPHAIPANAAKAANNLLSNTSPSLQSQGLRFSTVNCTHLGEIKFTNNNNQNKTFNNLNNIMVPPPVAFRNLRLETRHALMDRGSKTRSQIELGLATSHPVMKPDARPQRPPTPVEVVETEEGEEGEENGDPSDTPEEPPVSPINEQRDGKKQAKVASPLSPRGKKGAEPGKSTEVRYNAITGEIEIVSGEGEHDVDDGAESSDDEPMNPEAFSLESTLGLDSTLGIWNEICRSKGEHENKHIDPTHSDGPLEEVVGKKRVKLVTSSRVSTYNNALRQPAFQQWLAGQGLRMGSTLITTTAPSTSSFTEQLPFHLQGMGGVSSPKDRKDQPGPGGIGPTPPEAFACQDSPSGFAYTDRSLHGLLSEKGLEVEEVNLDGMTWLSDQVLFQLGELCPNVRMLSLNGCVNILPRSVMRIAEGCQLLAYINLGGCTQLTSESVSRILHNSQHLEVINLHGITNLDKDEFVTFNMMHACRSLKAIDLSYCTNISDKSLIAIAQYCPGLKFLNLNGCTSIGDLGMSAIGNKASNLNVLLMKLCCQPQLTSVGLSAIARAPRNLKHLDLAGLPQLNDATLITLLKQAPCLQTLCVSGCEGVNDKSIQMVNNCCQHLQRLDIASCTNIQLQTLMDLIQDTSSLRCLTVTNSCISHAEVSLLSDLRPSCRIVRSDYRPPPGAKMVVFKPPEAKPKKPKPDPKKGKK